VCRGTIYDLLPESQIETDMFWTEKLHACFRSLAQVGSYSRSSLCYCDSVTVFVFVFVFASTRWQRGRA